MKGKIFVGPGNTAEKISKIIATSLAIEKTAVVNVRNVKDIFNEKFVFFNVPLDTELLIIEDCPHNFDYEFFFPVKDNTNEGGDLLFKIPVERRGYDPKIILIPFLIIITEYNPVHLLSEYRVSFTSRFEIIRFDYDEFKILKMKNDKITICYAGFSEQVHGEVVTNGDEHVIYVQELPRCTIHGQLIACKEFIKAVTCSRDGRLTALKTDEIEKLQELYSKIKDL